MCCLFFFYFAGNAEEIELQVDDKHELYVDGEFKSSGEFWSHTYAVSVNSPSVLALYAENFVSTQ